MRLSEWLEWKNIDGEAMGARIRVSGQSIRRYASGERMPRPMIAKRLVEETRGHVTFQDLLDTHVEFIKECGSHAKKR